MSDIVVTISASGDCTSTGMMSTDPSAPSQTDVIVDILSILIAIVSFYIFLAQLVFCAIWYHEIRDGGGKYRTISNVLCTVAAVMTFFRVGIPLNFFISNASSFFCNVFYDFKVATYALAYITLWTVLWMRQRYFYHSSLLKVLYSMFIRIVSNGIEILVVLGVLGSTIHYFVTTNYIVTDQGCSEDIGDSDPYIWAVDFALIFLSQSILLALFLYPLWKHKRRLNNTNIGASHSSTSLTQAMIRATVMSGICMVLNLASIPIQYAFATRLESVFDILYDISLLMQLIAVIAVFKNWRQRFFPWLLFRRNSEHRSNFKESMSSPQLENAPSGSRAGPEYEVAV